jgi:hypothetical protein
MPARRPPHQLAYRQPPTAIYRLVGGGAAEEAQAAKRGLLPRFPRTPANRETKRHGHPLARAEHRTIRTCAYRTATYKADGLREPENVLHFG